MDSTSIIILIAVIAIAGFFFLRRKRPPAAGTYDDPKTRSSGSIGGGTRAHDDPKVRSGGSIGGGPRVYDSPEHVSEGSIAGQSQAARRARQTDGQDDADDKMVDNVGDDTNVEEPTYNERGVRSKGSIGST